MTVTDPNFHTLTLDAPVALTLNSVTVIASENGGLNMIFNAALQGAGSVNLQNSTLDLNGGDFTANGNGYQSLVDQNGEANGINLFNSSINSAGGDIMLTGVGGFANPGSGVSAGQGVGIFTGGAPLVALSTTGQGAITISGTTGQNIASTTPLIGFFLGHGQGVQAEDGTISITGAVGQGSTGVGTAADISTMATSNVESTTSTGEIDLTGSTAINVGGILSGYSVQVNSPVINLSGASVTTTAPGFFIAVINGASILGGNLGMVLSDSFTGSTGSQINITNSTINGTNMLIGNPSGTNLPVSQVSINDSSLQLVLGDNGTNGTTLKLEINGVANVAGAAGVSISNGSTITAVNGGAISITGTGLLSPTADATGVSILTSVLSCGTPTSTDGSLTITGTSDAGSTTLTSNSVFANNAYGVKMSGSTITSNVASGVTIQGTAYAANNLTSAGISLSTNTSIQQTGAGAVALNGTVLAENFGNTQGQANLVAGLQTVSTQIGATGAGANVSIITDTHQVTATDNGVNSVSVRNIGAYLQANTTVSASGSTAATSTPIQISGVSGVATAGSTNAQQTESCGLSLGGGTASGPITITNSGLGTTVVGGEAGSVTGGGGSIFSVGVLMGGSTATPTNITAMGGGSISLSGLGGMVAPNSHNTGQAVGVWSLFSNVTTTTGEIAITAFAGSRAARRWRATSRASTSAPRSSRRIPV